MFVKEKREHDLVTDQGILKIGSVIEGKGVVTRVDEFNVTIDDKETISIDSLGEYSLKFDDYNVYRWKEYYIAAKSTEHAQRVWSDFERSGVIIEGAKEPELFPKILSRLKISLPFPCIFRSLEWEEDDPLFEYIEEE